MSFASLSIDLDNQWSYQKTHGDAGWEEYPSYLHLVVPRILDFLAEFEIRSTIFIVGKDAELRKNRDAMRAIGDSGHEVANHSYSHDPGMAGFATERIHSEVAEAEYWIEEATGFRPKGFRAPGFSHSPALMELLARRQYLYDASTFPTFIGPVARTYHLATSNLTREEKQERKHLYGGWGDMFRTLHAHPLELEESQPLLEIPVTTMPCLRTPIHASYLLYLATYFPPAARSYFNTALTLCKLTRTRPSFVLHPTDFLGCDDVPELMFFPAMNQLSGWKVYQLGRLIQILTRRFEVGTMRDHARRAGMLDDLVPASLESASAN